MLEIKRPGTVMVMSALSVAAGIALIVYPPSFLSAAEARVAALTVVTTTFWATAIIPEYLTALFFFLFAMLFSIAPRQSFFPAFNRPPCG